MCTRASVIASLHFQFQPDVSSNSQPATMEIPSVSCGDTSGADNASRLGVLGDDFFRIYLLIQLIRVSFNVTEYLCKER